MSLLFNAIVIVSLSSTVFIFFIHLANHFSCSTKFPFFSVKSTIVGSYPSVALLQLLFAVVLAGVSATKIFLGHEPLTSSLSTTNLFMNAPSVNGQWSFRRIFGLLQVIVMMCVLLCESFFTFFRYTGTRDLSRTLRLVKLTSYLPLYSLYVIICFGMLFIAAFAAPFVWLIVAFFHVLFNVMFSYFFFASIRRAYDYVLENTSLRKDRSDNIAYSEIRKQIWAIKVNSVSCVLSSVANACAIVFGVFFKNQMFLCVAVAVNVILFAACFSLNRGVLNGLFCCRYCFGTEEEPDLNLMALMNRTSASMGARLSLTSTQFSLGGRTFSLPRLRSQSGSTRSEFSEHSNSRSTPRGTNHPPMFSQNSKSRSEPNVHMRQFEQQYSEDYYAAQVAEKRQANTRHDRQHSTQLDVDGLIQIDSYESGDADQDHSDTYNEEVLTLDLNDTLDSIPMEISEKSVSSEIHNTISDVPVTRIVRSSSDDVHNPTLAPPKANDIKRHSAGDMKNSSRGNHLHPVEVGRGAIRFQVSPRTSQPRRSPKRMHNRGKSAPASIKTISEEVKIRQSVTTQLQGSVENTVDLSREPSEVSSSLSTDDDEDFADKVLAMVDGDDIRIRASMERDTSSNRVTISRRVQQKARNSKRTLEMVEASLEAERKEMQSDHHKRDAHPSREFMSDEEMAAKARKSRKGRHRRSKVLTSTKEFDDSLRLIVAMQAMGLTVGVAHGTFENRPDLANSSSL